MSAALRIRPPAVAGAFYPADPRALGTMVDGLMAEASGQAAGPPVPKAVVVPHAGYRYSGAIAATGYAALAPAAGLISRVVIIGPAHRVWFEGVALPGADRLETPLGLVRVESPEDAGLLVNPRAHADEHSIEVQLPFIQRVLGDVAVVPLLCGEVAADSVAAVIEALWGDSGTAIVVSSDLSHYHAWAEAVGLDRVSAAQVEALGPSLTHDQACGATPINGLLHAARHHGLRAACLDLRNSGDTAGDRARVVGYGAFAFYEPAEGHRDGRH